MSYQDFLRLLMDVSEFDSFDAYVSEVGGSVPPSIDDEQLLPVLSSIWSYGNMRTVAILRRMTGLSQAKFAGEYNLPQRSVENWEMTGASGRSAPQYLIDLLAYAVICAHIG